ncbi:unannotated protein [freshwater metagenome]|uniref:Unannotated protein n=1 Tax=freshwater metagenome TaxID=449393 RepID=A0A6J7KLJ8_9ZZZZ
MRFRPHLLDDAHEHPSGAGHGIVHLAAAGDDAQHLLADTLPVAVVLIVQLAVRRRIEVEPPHAHANLICRNRGVGVKSPCSLRKDAARLKHAVQAHG